MASNYSPPAALTVLAGIFLAIGAVSTIIVTVDIILRRGWQSMMLIMIPVWIINASYLGPAALWVYWRYGRPTKPEIHMHHEAKEHAQNQDPSPADSSIGLERSQQSDSEQQTPAPESAHHSHDHSTSSPRPMWATVLVGVSHCGAGCVLGDLVGEWLVYGTNATINHESIWVELLVDYAWALAFGIIFQYFSIAPMSGEWGLKGLLRAVKADILSLTSFEVGLFGWMVAFQVGIWNYRLEITTWVYWWMMQVGMILGFGTAAPVNWWLISKGIKEPCA